MARNSGVDVTSSPSTRADEETSPSPAEVWGQSGGECCGEGRKERGLQRGLDSGQNFQPWCCGHREPCWILDLE